MNIVGIIELHSEALEEKGINWYNLSAKTAHLPDVTERNTIVTVRFLLISIYECMIGISLKPDGGYTMTIGEKIKQIRKDRGLTQEQLAEELIVSRAAVAKWENDNGVPDIDNLKKLSELFGMSIDELVDNSAAGKTKKTVTNEEYYASYIGRRCDVEMVGWNDGIGESYIVNQDDRFLYYVTIEKKRRIAGALAKKYIKSITLCSGKEKKTVNLSDFTEIQRTYFINKTTDVYLESKYFFSGIFGKDTEMFGVGIMDINDDYVKLVSGMDIEIEQITKMEITIV